MKTQEEYVHEIDEIVLHDVESHQSDWFEIDKEMFMRPENKDRTFILGTRKTGCDIIILGGANCNESRRGVGTPTNIAQPSMLMAAYEAGWDGGMRHLGGISVDDAIMELLLEKQRIYG